MIEPTNPRCPWWCNVAARLVIAGGACAAVPRFSFAVPPATQPQFDTPTLNVPEADSATLPRMGAAPDDPGWRDAALIPSLPLCTGPQAEGVSPTATRVLLKWDRKYLYVRFRCVDASIYAPHGTATNVLHSDGDVAEIFIDPVGDQRQFFELQCNPIGGWIDGVHVLTTQPSSDGDGVLSASVLKGDAWFFQGWAMPGLRIAGAPFGDKAERGWIADFALPAGPILRRLGLKKFGPMRMRVNLVRYDVSNPGPDPSPAAVDMAWSPVPWGRPHRCPALMGTIVLMGR